MRILFHVVDIYFARSRIFGAFDEYVNLALVQLVLTGAKHIAVRRRQTDGRLRPFRGSNFYRRLTALQNFYVCFFLVLLYA